VSYIQVNVVIKSDGVLQCTQDFLQNFFRKGQLNGYVIMHHRRTD